MAAMGMAVAAAMPSESVLEPVLEEDCWAAPAVEPELWLLLLSSSLSLSSSPEEAPELAPEELSESEPEVAVGLA